MSLKNALAIVAIAFAVFTANSSKAADKPVARLDDLDFKIAYAEVQLDGTLVVGTRHQGTISKSLATPNLEAVKHAAYELSQSEVTTVQRDEVCRNVMRPVIYELSVSNYGGTEFTGDLRVVMTDGNCAAREVSYPKTTSARSAGVELTSQIKSLAREFYAETFGQ